MNRLFAASIALFTVYAIGCSSPATSLEASAQAESAAVVQVVDTSAGKVLADASGFSLYTFDRDTTTDSTCYDACAAAWPAVLVSAEQALSTPFATTTRTDGSKQLTSQGHPLYRFARDRQPGDVKGDGFGGIWHLARPMSEAPDAHF